MTAWTAGPWVMNESWDGWIVQGRSTGLYSVARVVNVNEYPENEANAKLIVAAPDMAELLQDMEDAGGFGETWHERIRAALSRVKG